MTSSCLRRRVYGADHDHPGPRPDRRYAELVGGPLDGLLLDITGWRPEESDEGVSLLTELGQFGPGGRALYDPRPGDPGRFDWTGDCTAAGGTEPSRTFEHCPFAAPDCLRRAEGGWIGP